MKAHSARNLRGRLAAFGSVGGVAAVAALMLVLPVASATVITKPFKGYGVSLGDQKNWGACGKIKELKAPAWHAKTGMFTGVGSATSPMCKNPGSSQNFADWITQVNLVGTLHFKKNATYNITNFWKVAWAASWNTTPFKGCALNYSASFSTCAAYAEVQFYGQEFIYDQTTFTNFAFAQPPTGYSANFANYTSAQNYSYNSCPTCTPGGGNVSTPGPLAGSFSGTTLVNATIVNYTANNVDTYYYNVFCIVWVLTGAYVQNAHATTPGSGTASVNFGTLGKGITLQGIVIK